MPASSLHGLHSFLNIDSTELGESSMKLNTPLYPAALAVVMGISTSIAPNLASADLSASISASNLYLYRGDNLSGSSPQVSGSLDYSHESGAYAGIWGSSEGSSGTEYDLYVGFSGEVSGFGYDINFTSYEYPGSEDPVKFGSFSELILTFSFAGASLGIADNLQGLGSEGCTNDASGETCAYYYYSLGYETDMFGATLGIWDYEEDNATDDLNRTHLDLSFFANEELTFTLSQFVDAPDGAEDDLLFVVNWSKTFEI